MEEFFLRNILSSHWPVFLFTVKTVQDFFFSNLPLPPQNSNGPHLRFMSGHEGQTDSDMCQCH